MQIIMNAQRTSAKIEGSRFRSTPASSVTGYFLHEDTRAILEEVSLDRRLSNVTFDLRPGGADASAAKGRSVQSDVLIVEFDHDAERMLSLIDDIAANCSAQTKAIVIGSTNDALLFRALIGRGVSDYLVTPVAADMLIEAIGKLLTSSGVKHGRSIAFIGAKGGVGTSTVVQNVGWFLSDQCKKPTVVLDAHFGFGSVGLLFNANAAVSLADVPAKSGQIDDLVVKKLMTQQTERLSLLCAPVQFEAWPQLSEEAISSIVMTVQRQADCLLIDLPAHWDALSRRILRMVDDVVLVATPDLVGLRNTRLLADAVRSVRGETKDPLLVMNNVCEQKGSKIANGDFERIAGIAPAAAIRFDPTSFANSLVSGQPALQTGSARHFLHAISQMCQKLELVSEHKAMTRLVLPRILRRKNRNEAV